VRYSGGRIGTAGMILRNRPGLGKSGNRAAPPTTMPGCRVDGNPVCVKSDKSMKKNGNHDTRTIA
jgi:hypothetical protein